MGLTLLTAVVEVGDLKKGPDDNPVWIIGLVSFAVFAGLAGVFWGANDPIYNICQAPKDDVKNETKEEGPRLTDPQQDEGPASAEPEETK